MMPRGGPRPAPEDVVFRAKPDIALGQTRTALSSGVPSGVVLADAGYGVDTAFRSGLTGIGLSYIVGIQSSTLDQPVAAGEWSLCHPKLGAGAGDRLRSFGVTPSTNPSRPRNWRSRCLRACGAASVVSPVMV